MDIYTSISINYLPKARILAKSVKKFHPEWTFHLLISDRLTDKDKSAWDIDFNKEPFDRVVWIDSLDVDNVYGWIFKHTVVEQCTAGKGVFLQQLIKEGAEKIIYLDPDIAVFNQLNPLVDLLDDHAILLTPHLLDFSNVHQSILENEIQGTLRHGTFNLGFLAINSKKDDGKQFADWWGSRLYNYCYADYDSGLFTDQKWCDLVPSYFKDFHVIRDPGYNTASWNLDKRFLSFTDGGRIQINYKYPLRFYHFTGCDSGAGLYMTQRYSNGNQVPLEIWAWYQRQLKANGQEILRNQKWSYDYYNNGVKITNDDRQIYRQRKDLQEAFPNPFNSSNPIKHIA